MGIRERNGKWHYQFQYRGRTYLGSTGLEATALNRKPALEIEAGALADARRQVVRVREGKKFEDLAAEFVEWVREVEYRERQSTAARYIGSVGSMVEFFCSRAVDSITPGDVEQYKHFRLTVHKVKPVTLRHDLDALSLLNRYARKMRWTGATWLEDVKKPSGEAVRMHIFTDEEEARYFAAAAGISRDLYDLGRLAIQQGCRHNSELLPLRKTDVDLAGMKLRIRKAKRSDRGRTLDLTAESASILARRMASDGEWIFPSGRKDGQHLKKLQAAHDAAVERSGVHCVMYDWRHNFATRFAAEEKDPYALMAILGHRGLRSVMCYVHVQEDQMKRGMEKFEAARNRKKLRIVG